MTSLSQRHECLRPFRQLQLGQRLIASGNHHEDPVILASQAMQHPDRTPPGWRSRGLPRTLEHPTSAGARPGPEVAGHRQGSRHRLLENPAIVERLRTSQSFSSRQRTSTPRSLPTKAISRKSPSAASNRSKVPRGNPWLRRRPFCDKNSIKFTHKSLFRTCHS